MPLRRLALIPLLLCLPLGSALADELSVPAEFTSVQAAVDAAEAGDRIEIAPGTYEELVTLTGGLHIVGTGQYPTDTILSGSYVRSVVKLVGDSRLVILENISLQDGFAGQGGALLIDGGRAILRDVVFLGNGCSGEGGAIWVRNSDVEFSNCLFYGNYALGGGGGSIHLLTEPGSAVGHAIFENCSFAANSGCCGQTSLVMDGGTASISNSIIENTTCLNGAQAVYTCCLGDYCGTDGGGNFTGDPRYCGFEYADCRLEDDSPCLAENNPDCGLIGAYGACRLDPTPTESSSFSAIKARYR